MSKLTIEEQRKIYKLYEDGWPINQICKELKHSYGAVSRLLRLTGLNAWDCLKVAVYNTENREDHINENHNVILEEEFSTILDNCEKYRT